MVLLSLTSRLSLFGISNVVVGPIRALGGTLDHLITDVPNLVRVAVVEPICDSDHSSLSIAKAVPNLYVSRKVFLKQSKLE